MCAGEKCIICFACCTAPETMWMALLPARMLNVFLELRAL
jgi:hypothetical protein